MNELVVEHLKSGLSINTHIGCPLGCKYCVLSAVENYDNTAQKCATPQELIDIIMSENSLYVTDKTPLYINNRTDPFLPEVIDSTYEILSLLSANNIHSPILLITKLSPDKRISQFFDSLKILFFYTYAGLPRGIDYNSNCDINERNLANIYSFVPRQSRFLYFRPIIPGVNDDINILESIIQKLDGQFNSIVIGGIRIIEHNSENIYSIMKKKIVNFDYNHKYIEEKFYKETVKLSKQYGVNIIRHTSCAIACFLKEKVKLNYFCNQNHCNEICNNYNICNMMVPDLSKSIEKKSKIIEFIQSKIENQFTISKNTIHFRGRVDQELISCIQCAFGISVKADYVKLCPSEEVFMTNAASDHDMSNI